jgi:hypothetical protein
MVCRERNHVRPETILAASFVGWVVRGYRAIATDVAFRQPA